MNRIKWLGLAVSLAACASSSFDSSWKAPNAQPLESKDARVAAVVMMGDGASRRNAEDKLAQEITSRGGKGIPMYKIMSESTQKNEPAMREALDRAEVQGVVVIRPTADTQGGPIDYSQPPYNTYWGSGFYAHGWGQPWIDVSGMTYDFVVTVDTLIYSLKQNQLVWAGKSHRTNPASLNELVATLSKDTAEELNKVGLIAR